MVVALLIGVLVVAAGGSLVAILAFNQLVQHQYYRHMEEWVHAGYPIGFFWAPPGAGYWQGSQARTRAFFRWPFDPPGWARVDIRAVQLLRRMRLGLLVAMAGGIALVPVALLLSISAAA